MVFDPVTVQLIEFTDKVSGRRIVTPGRPSALFSLIRENPRYGMTAWRVGPYMNVDVLNSDRHSVRVIDYATTADRKWEKFRAEKDGLRKWLKFALGFGSSSITVTVELRGESDMVRFHVDADWREIGGGDIPQLQFSLPVSYDVGRYTYDIPMGMLTRDDTPHDVPGNSFIRLGDEGRAAFIVTDSKCGFRGHDNTGSVTLIRATDGPDRYPEIGEHHFGFGIGVCDKAEQKEMAAGFTHPLTYCTGTEHVGKSSGNCP